LKAGVLTMKSLGQILLLAGVLLLLTSWLVEGLKFFTISIVLLGIGVIAVLISSIREHTNKPFLCKIGFHRYKHIDWEQGSPRAIYQCERCEEVKRVMWGM
jgi:hypothetical protein